MMEDAVPFSGSSFCCAYATATAADSSAADAAADAAKAEITAFG